MIWRLSWRADPRAAALADRHYSRQTIGAEQFMPAGRCVVLISECGRAVWGVSWPLAEYVDHAWPGTWVCTIFRNEGAGRSSELITTALAATRWYFRDICPVGGCITFVDPMAVRHKRDPGRCFRRAGFRKVGETQKGKIVLQLERDALPPAVAPRGTTGRLAL